MVLVITAAAPQYRPLSPLSSVLPRTSFSPITPLTARTPVAALGPLSALSPVAPIITPGVTSPLNLAGVRDDPSNARVLRYENDNNGINGYSYA